MEKKVDYVDLENKDLIELTPKSSVCFNYKNNGNSFLKSLQKEICPFNISYSVSMGLIRIWYLEGEALLLLKHINCISMLQNLLCVLSKEVVVCTA